MSTKHLAAGSQEPPRVEGLLRLYSNYYCPYVERTRLVLSAKNIPHDLVNINLTSKPEWYFKINEQGKVPSLLDGSKIVIESLDISDYLNEKYPENPLYPSDPASKKRDKEVIENKIPPYLAAFGKAVFAEGEKNPEELAQLFLEALLPLEEELAKRGKTFFGGDQPGMVDYMLWPWEERAEVVALKLGKQLPIDGSKFPRYGKWKNAMLEHPVVKGIYTPPEKFFKLLQSRLKGEAPNYDD